MSRRSDTIVEEAIFQHICANDLLSYPFFSLCRGVSRSWKTAVVDGLKFLNTISFHVPWKVRKAAHDPAANVEARRQGSALLVSTGMLEYAFAAR